PPTLRATGSDASSAPTASTAPGAPPNVSRRLLPGTSLAPASWTPSQASAIGIARVPALLLNTTRNCVPPAPTRTTVRTDWFRLRLNAPALLALVDQTGVHGVAAVAGRQSNAASAAVSR